MLRLVPLACESSCASVASHCGEAAGMAGRVINAHGAGLVLDRELQIRGAFMASRSAPGTLIRPAPDRIPCSCLRGSVTL